MAMKGTGGRLLVFQSGKLKNSFLHINFIKKRKLVQYRYTGSIQ